MKLTDLQLALLGDKEAQDRISQRKELLPCRCSHSNVRIFEYKRIPKDMKKDGLKPCYIYCLSCGSETKRCDREEDAIKEWNSRNPILEQDQLEKLKMNLE